MVEQIELVDASEQALAKMPLGEQVRRARCGAQRAVCGVCGVCWVGRPPLGGESRSGVVLGATASGTRKLDFWDVWAGEALR